MVKSGLLWILLLCAETLTAQRFEVVITELMGDPLPSVGLPAEEFIELTNVSRKNIDLSGWKLSNGRTIGVLPDGLQLAPDSILIICAEKALHLFQPFGRTVAPDRFPVIANSGDTLVLMNAAGQTIHAVAWFASMVPPDKADGGWSLEMVNPKLACSFRDNWQVSNHASGGSPGQPNTHPSPVNLPTAPSLLHAWCPDPQRVILEFDDAIDPEAVENTSLYQTEPALTILQASALPPFYNQVECQLSAPLREGSIHWLQMTALSGCDLHPSGATRRVKGETGFLIRLSVIIYRPDLV